MKSLADLRADKERPTSLPTRVVSLCLDQEILADIQRLTVEKSDVKTEAAIKAAATAGTDVEGRPKRQGEGKPPPRLAEIDTELEPLYARMRDAEGELLLRANEGGTWLRWKADHPAVEKNEADERLAYGLCSAADLLDDLGKYVAAWNGDDFGPGEWDGWFKAKVAPADLAALVSAVVELHESRVNAPKLPSTSSAPQMSETG